MKLENQYALGSCVILLLSLSLSLSIIQFSSSTTETKVLNTKESTEQVDKCIPRSYINQNVEQDSFIDNTYEVVSGLRVEGCGLSIVEKSYWDKDIKEKDVEKIKKKHWDDLSETKYKLDKILQEKYGN